MFVKLTPSFLKKLRRIALDQQGLLKSNSFGIGKQATLSAIEHIAYVQIDTISVVERAHHHVLWSRISNYKPEYLDELVRERHLFEYWSHAAAWIPMRDYRFALPRMNSRNEERNWFENLDRKLIRHILKRIKEEGPLRARDFEGTRKGKKEWWDWKPAKRGLEQLFHQGSLMVSYREGFQKVYDLRERVLPDWVDTREPDLDEYASHLIDTTIRAHGFATQKSIGYLRKGKVLRKKLRQLLRERVDAKQLCEFTLTDGTTVYANAELLESQAPRKATNVRILSPFDNTLIQRERGRHFFDFDYQIECYVPEKKRRFGYFCLPILYGDTFVGRVDCKVHRKDRQLQVKSIHIEKSVDPDFHIAFQKALVLFARFNTCEGMELPRNYRI